METTSKRFGFEKIRTHGLYFFIVLLSGFSHADEDKTTATVSISTVAVSTTSSTINTTSKKSATAVTSIGTIASIAATTHSFLSNSAAASAATTTTTTAAAATSPTTTTNTTHKSGTMTSEGNQTSESVSSTRTTLQNNTSSDSSFTVSSDSSTASTMQLTTTPKDVTNIIIGVVVGVGGALALAVVVIIIVVCCWRRKGQLKAPVIQRSQISTLSTRRRQPPLQARPIKVSDFLEHVKKYQRDIDLYKTEFNELPSGNRVGKSVSKATQQQHSHLNRYINILPYNDTLVPLYKSDEQQGYINASFVDGYKKSRAYIASQAPVSESLGHFWQMIWEQKCGKIIMVTNLFECGRAKCDKYWPNVNDTVTYDDIRIEGIEEKSFGDYILRTFRVEKDMTSKEKPRGGKAARKSTSSVGDKQQELGERRLVYQFHFTTWPDQGVPSTCSALLKLYRHALKEPLKDSKDGPVVVHCSAGVGRTGTLIALDVSLEQAKDIEEVDIRKCIDTMRRQRMFMVQTVEQYIFIHHVLLEAMILDKVEMTFPQFESIYKKLSEPELPDGLSRLQKEMQVLDVLKPRFDHSQFSVAERHREKNRSSMLLPADMFLPYIKSDDGQSDIYVNAVHVYGCPKTTGVDDDDDDDDDDEDRIKYSYITTQSPMRETIEDFWMMIKETGSSTIVMLNELEGAERYWPEDGRTVEYGSFSITNMGEISSEDIRMTDLHITVRRKSEVIQIDPTSTSSSEYSNVGVRQSTRYDTDTFNIRHFRLLSWPDAMPKESTLIALYGEVIRCQERNPNRFVVVHCLNGVDRCGVFCGVMNVLDSIKHEREVDVFNAVKRIRRTRPEFIEDLSQYKFLYDVAFEWINNHETRGK